MFAIETPMFAWLSPPAFAWLRPPMCVWLRPPMCVWLRPPMCVWLRPPMCVWLRPPMFAWLMPWMFVWLMPPMFAWFPKDSKPQSRKYVNYLNRIDINKMIKSFNKEGGVWGITGFSNKGCRSATCSQQDGSMGNAKQHVFKDWRECAMGRQACLHLKKTTS